MSAVAPDMNRNDPSGGTFFAKCFARSSGPIALTASEAATRSGARSA